MPFSCPRTVRNDAESAAKDVVLLSQLSDLVVQGQGMMRRWLMEWLRLLTQVNEKEGGGGGGSEGGGAARGKGEGGASGVQGQGVMRRRWLMEWLRLLTQVKKGGEGRVTGEGVRGEGGGKWGAGT